MARIANTFFELKNGNRQYDAMANLAGVYQDAGTPEYLPLRFSGDETPAYARLRL